MKEKFKWNMELNVKHKNPASSAVKFEKFQMKFWHDYILDTNQIERRIDWLVLKFLSKLLTQSDMLFSAPAER